MGVLKWIGYILAAVLVLSVVLGGGIFIATVIVVGGALFCFVILVTLVAAGIKGYFESR